MRDFSLLWSIFFHSIVLLLLSRGCGYFHHWFNFVQWQLCFPLAGTLGLWCCFQSPAEICSSTDTQVPSASRLWCLTRVSMSNSSRMVLFPCGCLSWSILSCHVLGSEGGSLLLVIGWFVLLSVNAALTVTSTERCWSIQNPFVFVMVTGFLFWKIAMTWFWVV